MELKDKLALVGSVVSVIALVPPIVGVSKKPAASTPSADPAQVIHTHGDGTAINTGAGTITQNTHVDRSVHINESVSTYQHIYLCKAGLAGLWPTGMREVEPTATTVGPSTPVSIPKQQIRSPLVPVQGVSSSDRNRNTLTTTMTNAATVEANTIRFPAYFFPLGVIGKNRTVAVADVA